MPNNEVEYVPHYEVIRWSPKARMVAGTAGLTILVLAQRAKGAVRQIASFAGISLTLRALINEDLTQVIGTLLSPTIRLNREIVIDAPVDEVIAFLTKVENLPRFMSFIRKVEISSLGNLLWEASGPGGVPIHWETFVLSWAPNARVEWRTIPGSPIFNSGRMDVRMLSFDRCKLQVELVYALRAGSLGYAAARVLGFDPRAHIDGDLGKMKAIIEEEWKSKHETELPLSS